MNNKLNLDKQGEEQGLFNDIFKFIRWGWDKKGFEYIDDILTFLFVSVVLMIAIVSVLWIFYSVGGDVRGVEAETLGVKLIDSVVENGNFREGILEENFDVNDLMIRASIDKEIVRERGDYYFNLGIYKDGKLEKEFKEGKGSFEVSCKLKGSSENIPACYERELVVYDNDKKFVVRILTASNQEGRRI